MAGDQGVDFEIDAYKVYGGVTESMTAAMSKSEVSQCCALWEEYGVKGMEGGFHPTWGEGWVFVCINPMYSRRILFETVTSTYATSIPRNFKGQ